METIIAEIKITAPTRADLEQIMDDIEYRHSNEQSSVDIIERFVADD